MIHTVNGRFVIETENTSYAFGMSDTGHPEHYYYGKKIHVDEELKGLDALAEKKAFPVGNSVWLDSAHKQVVLDDMCLEFSGRGKGDTREPFLEIVYPNGSRTSDFRYEGHEIRNQKEIFGKLPQAYGASEELAVFYKDRNYPLTLTLRYDSYDACDVITRSAVLTNHGNQPVTIGRLMSLQLDLPLAGYDLTTFSGRWAGEMNRNTVSLVPGKFISSNHTGTGSGRSNPFVMLSEPGCGENHGRCIGLNLIYSGNHRECVEVSARGKLRFLTGIDPDTFEWTLEPGESLETPEAVLTWSNAGFNGMSQHMHAFVREHIVRGTWQHKYRPVLLNSWEAAYFDINENKILKLAKTAKAVGIELIVMDDGWFGERNDDTCSLGDWEANPKKLPHGLNGLCSKIRELGLEFGLWVEPEMVNVNSRLYSAHPDWCIEIPGQEHSEERNQRVLDLGREEVVDYLIEAMSSVFASAEITYVKWDMNRNMSDYYSAALTGTRQGETAHRYMLGFYRLADTLTKRFPQILFEGCASGGNRFDLGVLCYFPQIWGSDNTDAVCRAQIQTGYSYAYPPETVGAHVSGCPNHQTLRNTPLETRFAVASFGSLGYECNLCDLYRKELDLIKVQIALYKELRETMQFGHFYRGRTFGCSGTDQIGNREENGNICEWTVVSQDQKKAVGMLMQKNTQPNAPFQYYRPAGLKEDARYHFSGRELKHSILEFGDLVNTVAPIHIRKNSQFHHALAQFVRMDGENEDYTAYGDQLMEGVKLKQAYAATGYNDQVRYFPDFAARMYFMDEM